MLKTIDRPEVDLRRCNEDIVEVDLPNVGSIKF